LQQILGTVALGPTEWAIVVAISIFEIVVLEFTKFLFRFFSNRPVRV
jgi:hypothetical protein